MKFLKIIKIFMITLLCIPLYACGPKEVGYSSSYQADGQGNGVSTAEAMRYPFTGSTTTQIMLYNTNRPQVMEQVQKWTTAQYRKSMGLEPLPEEPEYREHPKQRSPFRQ